MRRGRKVIFYSSQRCLQQYNFLCRYKKRGDQPLHLVSFLSRKEYSNKISDKDNKTYIHIKLVGLFAK